MRKFGTALFLIGAAGFFYCASQLGDLPAVPTGLSISEALQYPAGKLQIAEYTAAAVAAAGLLFLMFPSGR